MAKPYIHGFSRDEQSRLVEQAEVLAPNVFRGIDFSPASEALEIGCGSGSQAVRLIERGFDLVALDLSIEATRLASIRATLRSGSVPGRSRVPASRS